MQDFFRAQSLALDALALQNFPFDDFLDLIGDESLLPLLVTGVGKSGHIARKVASMFTAFGYPAFFLDPSDAAHGDLGAIRASTILIFSKSGNTKELRPVIDYAVKQNCDIVAVTMATKTYLTTYADIVFALPDLPEAGHLGLAPTTSTTMMLAFGDALALAWAKDVDLIADDFLDHHPGGALGETIRAENVA